MEERSSCCSAKRSNISNQPKLRPNQAEISKTESNAAETNGMLLIPGGEFLMGSTDEDSIIADGEGPIRKVTVNPFYMDTTTVTNEQFRKFIQETGYVTESEAYGWSFVFHLLVSEETRKTVNQSPKQTPWWYVVEGATWDHPEGPDSTIENRMDHPVIHMSWNDAQVYCKWSGKRLPTEAEWEFAARGGLEQNRYPWGNELTPESIHQCNVFQGVFPHTNTAEDGFISTAPVKAFTPNGYGLYNVAGNVWEWCHDWFHPDALTHGGPNNPQGPKHGSGRIMRGGSYLCHASYCNRYRVGARTSNTPDSSTGNIGFRCVKDI